MSIRHSLLIVVAAAACSGASDAPTAHGVDTPPPPTPAFVASITLTPIPDLAVGDSVRVTAILRDAAGEPITGRNPTWTSSDSSAASIDSTGMVRALLPATVTITATSGGVTSNESANMYEAVVSSLAVAPPTDTLFTERQLGLFVTARDQFGRPFSGRYSIKWTSSDLSVATVDTTGRVTAVAPGSSSVTATVNAVSAASVITVVVGSPKARLLGDWTMTMSPSPSCRDRFPEIARTRTYTVRFTQPYSGRMDLRVDITGESAYLINPGSGGIDGIILSFVIGSDTGYSGWSSGDLYDRLSTTQLLNVWGVVSGDISDREIHATMTGEIDYWAPGANIITGPTVVCYATDHTVTLNR
jgi:Bacterial Ig-like domain (group 2)